MKKRNEKVNAAIIVIGNEILSGRTQDTNVITIANWLNDLGVKLEEVRIIPDIENIIIKTINEVRKKFNYIFTTGGIGPTHDDITASSISKAFKTKYGYHNEAYQILEKYYGKEKFNQGRKKMAKMPIKSLLILNPSSGAPGFIMENVYSLPGVPSILKSMLGGLKNNIKGGKKIISKTITMKTVESEIAKPLKNIQNQFKNLEIGSYPFFRLGRVGVSLVIRSVESKKINLCVKKIIQLANKKNIKIIKR
tara:strand:- start:3902 stop:4654 length:753 start_codon:yes stop_codon:yes gene_type:complete